MVPLQLGLVESVPRKCHYVIFPKIPFNYTVFPHKWKKSNRHIILRNIWNVDAVSGLILQIIAMVIIFNENKYILDFASL